MNPALLIVAAAAGSILLTVGVLGAVQSWFPLAVRLTLIGVGVAVESLAVLTLVRSRQARSRHRTRRAANADMRPQYEHTQAGWPIRIALCVTAIGLLVVSALPPMNALRTPPVVLWVGAALAALFGWIWGALTVRIVDGELQVRFGLGWPRKTLKLAEIAEVEVTSTTFMEGWGVRLTRRGWLFNVSGYDAVLLRLAGGKMVMVGSDEPRKLKAALERALARA